MANFEEKLNKFALELFKIEVLKFGDFKMKVGINSPVYFDLRSIISYPKLLDKLADLLCEFSKNIKCDQLCGVPYTALPIATLMSTKIEKPMLVRRKEQKAYGTKKLIEGRFNEGERCLIVEDVVTSGSSILETVRDLRKEGLNVTEAIVVLDRQQGGGENLQEDDVQMHSLFTINSLLKILLQHKCIDQTIVDKVHTYIKNSQIRANGELKNGVEKPKNRLHLSFADRSKFARNSITKKLFELMDAKETNLCVALDVTDSTKLLDIAESIGPHICVLKTHIDIISNFNVKMIQQLKAIAKKHNFLIFEDRKFADIGNTVKLQYTEGVYNISSWADIVTVHALPGPGIMEAIKQSIENSENSTERGVFVLAEMSSANNLITNAYSQEALRIAEQYKDITCGIICQSKELVSNPGVIQLTPGVQLNNKNDDLGQQYNSPEAVIYEKGADIAIVGRAIISADNIKNTAEEYRKCLWAAYKKRLVVG